MYDDSELTTYDGSINYLYLYDNAAATFFGLSYMNELYIDPALENTSQVTFYATFDRWEPFGPNGRGHLYGNWLTERTPPFVINLVSDGAYSKVQFIPEPATIFLFAIGGLALRKKNAKS